MQMRSKSPTQVSALECDGDVWLMCTGNLLPFGKFWSFSEWISAYESLEECHLELAFAEHLLCSPPCHTNAG